MSEYVVHDGVTAVRVSAPTRAAALRTAGWIVGPGAVAQLAVTCPTDGMTVVTLRAVETSQTPIPD